MSHFEVFKYDPGARHIPAGEVLFHEGDTADTMFIVLEGEVDLTLDGSLIDTACPGHVFGEMAMIEKGTRSSTARARTDAFIVPVDRSRFLYLVQNTPHFAVDVMASMAYRLRRIHDCSIPSTP